MSVDLWGFERRCINDCDEDRQTDNEAIWVTRYHEGPDRGAFATARTVPPDRPELELSAEVASFHQSPQVPRRP